MERKRKYVGITFEPNLRPEPDIHELWAARIIAEFYCAEVMFLRRGIDKTADFKINGKMWELKSPRGNGKRTIENNLRSATRQSQNVIISLYRTKLTTKQAISRINYYIKNEKNSHIKSVLIISKSGKVIDLL